MKWRVGIILFALFQFFWLNVYIPGHTRGTITFARGEAAAGIVGAGREVGAGGQDKGGCCAADRGKGEEPGGVPSPRDKAHCVVCYFAAGLATPPAEIVAPSPFEFARPGGEAPAVRCEAGPLGLPLYATGPPGAA